MLFTKILENYKMSDESSKIFNSILLDSGDRNYYIFLNNIYFIIHWCFKIRYNFQSEQPDVLLDEGIQKMYIPMLLFTTLNSFFVSNLNNINVIGYYDGIINNFYNKEQVNLLLKEFNIESLSLNKKNISDNNFVIYSYFYFLLIRILVFMNYIKENSDNPTEGYSKFKKFVRETKGLGIISGGKIIKTLKTRKIRKLNITKNYLKLCKRNKNTKRNKFTPFPI